MGNSKFTTHIETGLLVAFLLGSPGCAQKSGLSFQEESSQGESGPGGNNANEESESESNSTTPANVRPLSNEELNNAINDLLLDSSRPATLILPEESYSPFNNNVDLQIVSQPWVEAIENLAEDVAKKFSQDKARSERVLGCTPITEQCIVNFTPNLLKLAFRRPVEKEASTEILKLVQQVIKEDGTTSSGLYILIRYTLQHPEFLFRIEKNLNLNAFELATRLSFLLWGSIPDNDLLKSAENGELSDSDGIKKVALRMLNSEKAADRINRFHSMWLGFPNMGTSMLAQAMVSETNALLKRVIVTENKPWSEIFTSETTYLNAELAAHYGLSFVGNGSQWISYGNSPRRGIFSHGSFLSTVPKFGDTSPTQRGIHIRKRLLCQTVPPPPPDANVDNPPASETGSRCKEDRYLSHRKAGSSCFGCHQQLDPIGFGLENFDQLGRFRTAEADKPECVISGRGEVAGVGIFSGPRELGALLINENDLFRCVAQHYHSYAIGRIPQSVSASTATKLFKVFEEKSFKLKDFIIEYVASEHFRTKSLE